MLKILYDLKKLKWLFPGSNTSDLQNFFFIQRNSNLKDHCVYLWKKIMKFDLSRLRSMLMWCENHFKDSLNVATFNSFSKSSFEEFSKAQFEAFKSNWLERKIYDLQSNFGSFSCL